MRTPFSQHTEKKKQDRSEMENQPSNRRRWKKAHNQYILTLRNLYLKEIKAVDLYADTFVVNIQNNIQVCFSE